MRFSKLSAARRLLLLALVSALLVGFAVPASATESKKPYQTIITNHREAEFMYELFLTDQNGMTVDNPRKLKSGDTLSVEIRLTRNGYKNPGYDSYGIEFRLLTRGLDYNYDGTTLRGGTDVREMNYYDGDSVGFAWYDFQQVGERINNPVLAASWTYTVTDPKQVNITVPVALIYITGDEEEHIPLGPAKLYLEFEGGTLVGEDISGEYSSGTTVVLPDLERPGWVFLGWSDGARIYPAGTEYTVSGIVTLTAVWEEPERNRYLTLDPKGGELIGEDISGYYADGEIVTLPEITREGYLFQGWSDGVETYDAGAKYTVYNTVIIAAQWMPVPTGPAVDPNDPTGNGTALLCGLGGISGLLLLLLLLWKRRFVKYSLVNGDIALNYKNGDMPVEVEVVLYDGEQEYRLNKSGVLEAKYRLQFIKNVADLPVAEIKPGTYKGKLLIHIGSEIKVEKCRIKALDKELTA